LHLCCALLQGKDAFTVKRGRQVHGKKENHGKKKATRQRNTTRQKPRNNRTAKKNGTTKTRNNTQQRKTHDNTQKRPTTKKIHDTPLGRAHLYGAVDGGVVTVGLCRMPYCQARQIFELPNSTLAQKFPAICFYNPRKWPA
jgi:hypothetical protein